VAADFNAAMRGAYDLSSLKNPAPAQPTGSDAQPAAQAAGESQGVLKVTSYFVELTEANLRGYISASQDVVMLLDFYSTTDEGSRSLSQKLMELVDKAKGAVLLGRVNLSEHARLAEAFNVQQPATFMGLLKGQPVPLTQGDQPEDVLLQLVDKLLQVAQSNGITGRAELDAEAAPIDSTPKLPPAHQVAVSLLNEGKYSDAKAAYEQILRDAPADTMAVAGLAQSELLVRLDGVDVDKVLNTPPQNFDELLQSADALIAIGDYADGFDAILKNYSDADDEMKPKLRDRLLSYFEIVGKTTPEVVAARARLTSLLF
jgi:putative thioredoxin